jgi:hypothetical protein
VAAVQQAELRAEVLVGRLRWQRHNCSVWMACSARCIILNALLGFSPFCLVWMARKGLRPARGETHTTALLDGTRCQTYNC